MGGVGLRWVVLFDSHNHLQSDRFTRTAGKTPGEMVAEMREAGVGGCVVNGTWEGDWDEVAALAEEFEGFVFPAYGIHPWRAATVREGWEGRLRQRLEADPRATVGEIGVDGWVDAPGMGVQREVFLRQVRMAAEMRRVMTVHCLKAWGELFSVMDEVAVWPERFLMHSFGGSAEVAERLLKKGGWFSFSGYFLEGRKAKVLEVFRGLPRERVLLETDAPEMMPPGEVVEFPLVGGVNHPANLRGIARAFQLEMGMESWELEMIGENTRRFFNFP